MKILIYKNSSDFNFDSIVDVLSQTKYQIGYMSGDIDTEAISKFNPDLIIHNIPDIDSFPSQNNAISININETDHDRSFSFTNKKSKNYLEAFVSLKDTSTTQDDLPKFKTDVVYIGSPFVFNPVLKMIEEYRMDIKFKFFSLQPHNVKWYCGTCNGKDYFRFYKHAKCSIVQENDTHRIMDIIAADGNPVIYQNGKPEECFNQILDAVFHNKSMPRIYNRNDIITNHTSFDRTAHIFKTIGLNKISKNILSIKESNWNKK